MKNLFVFLLLGVFFCTIHGQNLESIGKGKPLKINGGLSINQTFYETSGMQSRRDPYTYYLTGNINFNLYGWAVPLSFMYSNQQSSFQQPFNQYGLHPTYKWIVAHIGYCSMSFSPYTLNGHQFLGVGAEFNPGKNIYGAMMYGRLKKSIEFDTANTNSEPSYKRVGWGIKTGYKIDMGSIEINTFRSKDDISSINTVFDSLEIYPEENFVISVNTSLFLMNRIKFNAEYASSMITRDMRSDILSENILFTRHTSTEQYKAIKATIKYSSLSYSAGITFERTDPGYRTHGSYYFNNDMENITANLSVSLLKNKLSTGMNFGVQRDDLNNKKMSNMLRIVQSYNIGFVPVARLNISATYSNFNSHTNIKSQFDNINQLTPYDNLDTLTFTQISQNSSLNINYAISNKEKSRQYLCLNSSYQVASEQQEQIETNSGAKFLNTNLAHNYTLVQTNTSFTTALNYSLSSTSIFESYTVGITENIRKVFFKNQMRSSLSVSLNNTYSNSLLTNNTMTLRLNIGYTLKKKHNFNLSNAIINRYAPETNENNSGYHRFIEYTITFGYNYNF